MIRNGDNFVAQVSNLLYRSASSLRGQRSLRPARTKAVSPIGNRRYSRLETCATCALAWDCRQTSIIQTKPAFDSGCAAQLN
ncbi:MAG: hypothetical protein C5B50_23530 [Verrucomicrobia bacterium]|nr:MAG: hypothetical protein C5B50_23530 [Verrucomicrobiota bacterium]